MTTLSFSCRTQLSSRSCSIICFSSVNPSLAELRSSSDKDIYQITGQISHAQKHLLTLKYLLLGSPQLDKSRFDKGQTLRIHWKDGCLIVISAGKSELKVLVIYTLAISFLEPLKWNYVLHTSPPLIGLHLVI